VDPVSAVHELCPDCDSILGCTGAVTITDPYQEWENTTGMGYCKKPTKKVIIGATLKCTEDWDVDVIVACAAAVGISCTNIPVCVTALLLGGYTCLHDGICSVVDGCGGFGAIVGDPIEKDNVDWSVPWGDFRDCGY
jgi:hypothetical protein